MFTNNYINMCDDEDLQKLKSEFDFGDYYSTIDTQEIYIFTYGRSNLFKNEIWIPRVDQLMKLLRKKYDIPNLIVTFYDWYRGHTVDNFNFKDSETWQKTMEELWLSFFMYEMYNKTWDGKKWVKGE